MDGWLLDTNVISEVTRPKPDEQVIVWLECHDPRAMFLSAPTLGELVQGAERLPPGNRRRAIERWIEHDLLEEFGGRVLAFDTDTAIVWGRLMAENARRGTPRAAVDAQIAATAAHHHLTLVTRNVRDFEGLLSDIVNPWSV